MPAKSRSQFREMFVLKKQGKITDSQLKDFTHNVDYKALPNRIGKKKKVYKMADKDHDRM